MSTIYWITPTLAIATDWPEESLFHDAESAASWITAARGGPAHTAMVATDEIAKGTLLLLGLTPEEADDRIAFAKGELYPDAIDLFAP